MRRSLSWERAGGAVLGFALVVLVGATGPGATGASTVTPEVLIRPVLCAVPPYDRYVTSPQPTVTAASCGPSSVTPASMAVTPSKTAPAGFVFQTPQPALILEGVRTTKPAHDTPAKVVLLAGLPGSSVYSTTPTSKGMRYVLAPAVMTSKDIASATATKVAGRWVVDWTTTSSGAAVWNRVARAGFHQLLAFDVGGTVVSAPIIEPTQATFTSFKGRGEVSGNWSEAEATRIASAMQSGN